MRLIDPRGLSPTCYLEGFATDCSQVVALASNGAAALCPDNNCWRYDSTSGEFQQFIATADGASGYVGFSTLDQLNDCHGTILNDSAFYSVQRADPAYSQQLDLTVRAVAAYAKAEGFNYSYDDIRGWIIQSGYGSNGAPELHGGNWNFRLADVAPADLLSIVTGEFRVSGWDSLHLHDDGHFHVDTASGGLLCGIHGLVDVFLGNTIFASMGIPRQ